MKILIAEDDHLSRMILEKSLQQSGYEVTAVTRAAALETFDTEDPPRLALLRDVDHFKQVNDQFRHNTGDDVLRELARRLQHSVWSYDIVGRYGGEELLVILNKCDPASVETRAENLRAAVSKSLSTRVRKPYPSPSVWEWRFSPISRIRV